jgi:YidC/Oxa1 family membrane protein insertase
MEDRRIDPLQIIGMVLIFAIFTWMMYTQPALDIAQSEESIKKVDKIDESVEIIVPELDLTIPDSVVDTLRLENDVLSILISTKGANMIRVELLDMFNYYDEPLCLVNKDNSSFNITFTNLLGQLKQTKFLQFKHTLSQTAIGQQLKLRSPIDNDSYIEMIYTLPESGYRFGFQVIAQGVSNSLDSSIPASFTWRMDGFRHAKSAQYENRYTQLAYNYEGDKYSSLSAAGDDDKKRENVGWVSYRQHFFSSIIIPEDSFKEVVMRSNSITAEQEEDSEYLKSFSTKTNIDYGQDGFEANFNLYMGPTDYSILKEYEENLDQSISFGWGLIGWINRSVFYPLFSLLSGIVPQGIAIILLTIIVRLILSPVLYKSYVSQAKMRVLRPEITAISEKYKNEAGKRQQETMKLYNKAGASPMAGCIPALIQMPVFFALFYFFPIAYELRGKSFLWADDLSSYDMIAELPFSIPFYGDHVSLFPLLASIAIFFYTQMTAGQQVQPTQPGMPNMKFIMYLMPVMMLFFFNNYASGFSLYYFVSNLLMIGIMLVIKNVIIDQDKIHAQIEENKKKPKKQNRFQRKMAEIMEEAERQKNLKR